MGSDRYEIEPEPHVRQELEQSKDSFADLAKEATAFFNDGDVEDMAVARTYIERGYSEDFAYWLVREVNVRRASGVG